MVRALPVPNRSISGLMKGSSRELGVVGLELLKADQIGSRFSQLFEQSGKAAIYSVDVVCSDGQRSR